jgi:PPOX class probable F420-dependent enzyme
VDLDDFRAKLTDEHGLVVVSTARAGGAIQSTLVNAGVMDHPITDAPVVAFVAVGGSVKLANLRARPWATVTVRSGWRWGTVEGSVELAGPDDVLAGVDDVPALLRGIFTAAGGTHDDWDEFDATMSRERRAGVFVTPGRVYGV